ncbi:MAG: UDP-N-acetylglucosamine 4,6-dehydratase (inverting) [Patescibacteria group bacterium]|nr:UDP-N-acetylglucosamine 4,6-dehydratase (inverting) [Patescibacteria group bacterium]
MLSIFKDKNVLVTGGTGTFGQNFIKTLIEKSEANKIIIFSRDELKQSQMQVRFKDPRLRFFIGDIRDKERLDRAFKGVNCIVHAAALKQVPALEYNPFEAVKTNILGTQNVVNAAIDQGVEKVLLLSTDKAANPINLYGATKLCAEKLFVAANSYSAGATKLSVLRYGNVLGSRGSLLDVIKKQKLEGKLKITDERMTRFWITIDQAIVFAIKSMNLMKGGEIFVPKIPSMKIIEIFDMIAPGMEVEKVGIRPGEKLHEMLLGEDEARNAKELEEVYVIEPRENLGTEREHKGVKVQEGFVYASNNNTQWLNPDQLKEMIGEK